eukprot:TRINITY_DN9353_c0_g1_i1.p1 TRINITY_DN9353_c0_g1~~TRINITY_DN9353_c0_g1_i1.p1  ORF type:complete len:371 (-),score=54.82 TRINITY_DN9353_c0_g1_i1:10-1101(-)
MRQSLGRMPSFLQIEKYEAPEWARQLNVPKTRCGLAHLPTPIYPWKGLDKVLPQNVHWLIKRDDLTGSELSGNKVRKLEFLLADAIEKGCDTVVTVGGIQSNHCRATAVACRMMGLEPYLILRSPKPDEDPGLVGNLLPGRLVGAHLRLVDLAEYTKHGGTALVNHLADALRSEGKAPYPVVAGGSDSVGTWGYIEAIKELQQQLGPSVDHIVLATGSGGTAAGIALGVHLSGLQAKVHAIGVCDDPDYFYDYIQGIANGMGFSGSARDLIQIYQGKGIGYSHNTAEELQFVTDIALATGVLLDGTYTGKAFYGFVKEMEKRPAEFEGKRILFWHTGGVLGLFEKAAALASTQKSTVKRLFEN